MNVQTSTSWESLTTSSSSLCVYRRTDRLFQWTMKQARLRRFIEIIYVHILDDDDSGGVGMDVCL
jgi:hypothetical protein